MLSSHAKLRSEVVPKVDDKGPKQLALLEHDRTVLAPEPRKKPWAWLLRHVFQIDVVTCVRCGGTTRLLEAATAPEAIAKLLAEHGLGPSRRPDPVRPPSTFVDPDSPFLADRTLMPTAAAAASCVMPSFIFCLSNLTCASRCIGGLPSSGTRPGLSPERRMRRQYGPDRQF